MTLETHRLVKQHALQPSLATLKRLSAAIIAQARKENRRRRPRSFSKGAPGQGGEAHQAGHHVDTYMLSASNTVRSFCLFMSAALVSCVCMTLCHSCSTFCPATSSAANRLLRFDRPHRTQVIGWTRFSDSPRALSTSSVSRDSQSRDFGLEGGCPQLSFQVRPGSRPTARTLSFNLLSFLTRTRFLFLFGYRPR